MLESNQTQKSNHIIDQRLGTILGEAQASTSEYVPSEGWLDISIEEMSREDLQGRPHNCYLINFDLEYPPDMEEGIYVHTGEFLWALREQLSASLS